MKSAFKLRKPRTDDRLPWNIMAAIHGTPAVLVAYQLKLYSLLADKPSSLDEICEARGLKRRPAEAILAVTTSLGITRLREGRYSLTPAGTDYFIETSPTYSGALFDLTIDKRVRAAKVLSKLPDRTYRSHEELLSSLEPFLTRIE